MTTPRLTAQSWVLIIVLATIWGSSFLFVRIAVLEIPPLTLVFLRVALAALVLNLYLILGEDLRLVALLEAWCHGSQNLRLRTNQLCTPYPPPP